MFAFEGSGVWRREPAPLLLLVQIVCKDTINVLPRFRWSSASQGGPALPNCRLS